MKQILTFILFMSVLVAFSNEGWVKLYKLHQFEKTLQDENRTVVQNNESLRMEIQRLKEPKYLEHYIRQQIGFIRKNELIYEFVKK